MAAFLTGKMVVGAPGDVHDTARNPVGMESPGVDKAGNPARYVYLKGVASTIEGSWVTYDEAGLTTNLATDSKPGPVAIATGAVVASKWGWYGIEGYFICGAISGGDAAVDAPVYATSTDFLPDDVEADDMSVIGATFRTQEGEAATALGLVATAALATAQIHRPWFGLATDASA